MMATVAKTDLSKYDNSWYSPKAGFVKRLTWYFVNVLVMMNKLNPSSGLRKFFLKLYGARIGKGVIIKPGVNVKYPWLLSVGDFTWIGEDVWIDNLTGVRIGNHCCLSQGAMLLSGNHNYKVPTFDLMVREIVLEDGVWIGAKSLVGPGVTCHSHSVLSVNSVTSKDLDAFVVYAGNPCKEIRKRKMG